MKIQCDVCQQEEACWFCVADEAALCQSCDHTIHHANKLASGHHRFSLLHPSPKQSPLCDICQERRAFLFCQQDRAILCRGCDVGIHKSNENTKKHNRFLLTGVKISATSSLHSNSSPSSSSATSITTSVTTTTNSLSVGKQKSTNLMMTTNDHVCHDVSPSTNQIITQTQNNPSMVMNDNMLLANDGVTSSSISEYMQMLPGYHVEELLDCSYSPCGFYKIGDNFDGLPFWGSELESNTQSTFWNPTTLYGQIEFKNSSMEDDNKITSSRKWRDDSSFAVPQVKKSRNLF